MAAATASTSRASACGFTHAVDTPGAVVLGGDYQGLGIVRSLGARRIPICVVDDETSISSFSRYCKNAVRVGKLRDERQIVDQLLAIGTRLGLYGWVLYPTRDELVAAFSKSRAQLNTIFRVPTPEWETVKWAWDKRNTYRLAQELRIPTPLTYSPPEPEALDDLSWPAPYVIKPAIKEHFIYATKAKAWRADNRQDLVRLLKKGSELTGPGEMMVQELIPGGGSQQFSYCAFFKNGEAIGKMVARRTRQHPLEFGRASTFVETVDIPLLEALSERFLRAIDYYGLVELEYKLDPRDNQFKLLDVNARTWGYHALGAKSGVDFSYLLYADQAGIPCERCESVSGLAWVRILTDFPTAMLELLHGRLDLRGYFRTLRSCNLDAVFSTRDPFPGLAELFLVPYLAMKRGF